MLHAYEILFSGWVRASFLAQPNKAMDPNKVSRMQQAAGPTQGLRDPRAVAECNQCTRAVRKSMWSIQAGRSIQNT